MNNIAGVMHRFVSGAIDLLVLSLPSFYLINNLSQADQPETILDRIFSFIILTVVYGLAMIFINSLMISKFGGTIGKILTGLYIVSPDGNNISFWRAILRNYLGYTVSSLFLWLGFIWIMVDKERQGWHDMMANTYVVIKNKSRIIFAVIILVLLSWLSFSLINTSITNFISNSNVYSEMINVMQPN